MGRTALMHVRNLRLYQTMQFVLDLLAVSVAWTCTIQMRVLLNPLATQHVAWTYASIWAPSLMMVLVLWIIMAWRLRFYRVEGRIRLWNSFVNALEGALLASCNIVIVTFFSRPWFLSAWAWPGASVYWRRWWLSGTGHPLSGRRCWAMVCTPGAWSS